LELSDEEWQKGTRMRRAVLGDEHVDRSERQSTAFDADFQSFITRTAWGNVWTRPGLPVHTRHLLTLAVLASLGRMHELELHLKATKNTGVTPDELKELFLQVAVYAGVPAANAAMAVAKRVLFPKDAESGG
jgi:4-carboxymuconolactone decarboxylase